MTKVGVGAFTRLREAASVVALMVLGTLHVGASAQVNEPSDALTEPITTTSTNPSAAADVATPTPSTAATAKSDPRSARTSRALPAAQAASALSSGSAAPSNLGIDLRLPMSNSAGSADTSSAVRVVLGLTLLAVLPALLVCLTSFLRIIIVLSMLRHAIGMPETPPNTVLIGLALFLTLFTMSPVLQVVNRDALQPFMQGQIGTEAAYAKASHPMRDFMAKQTRESDIALMIELAKAPRPVTMDDVSNAHLVPAFMLSELRAAFQIGFVVFLPFLLIDLIVSSVLMALGMMMMPPVTIALPLKLLMFILVDGWSLILKALVGSFH